MPITKIIQLQEVNTDGSLGAKQYPITVASAVYLPSGDTVDNVLDEIISSVQLKTANWTIKEENDELVFKHGTTVVVRLNKDTGFMTGPNPSTICSYCGQVECVNFGICNNGACFTCNTVGCTNNTHDTNNGSGEM